MDHVGEIFFPLSARLKYRLLDGRVPHCPRRSDLTAESGFKSRPEPSQAFSGSARAGQRSLPLDLSRLLLMNNHKDPLQSFFSEDNGFVDDVSGIEWEIVRQPSVDSAFERADPGNSFRPQ